jgi:hypothetical protein
VHVDHRLLVIWVGEIVRGHARAQTNDKPIFTQIVLTRSFAHTLAKLDPWSLVNPLCALHSNIYKNYYDCSNFEGLCYLLKNPKSAYEAANILYLHGQSNSASSCYAPPGGAVCILHNRNTPKSPRRTPAVLGERNRSDSNSLPAASRPTPCMHTGHSRVLMWWRKRLFSLSTGRFQRWQRLNSQILRRVTDEPSTPPEHGQLIGPPEPSHFWVVGASSRADINKPNLLTNISWIATLEEQEANLYLVMRKTSLTPTYHLGGRAEANCWKSADAETHQ